MTEGSRASSSGRPLLQPAMLAVHGVALIAVVVCLIGAYWQLDVYRAEQDAGRAERSAAPARPLTDVLGPDEGLTNEMVGARVTADGQYAPAGQQILVSGRSDAGRDGYWVVSPLILETGSAILVVRGWTDREQLPPVPSAPVTVTGSLEPGEQPGADADLGPDRVVDSIRIPSLVGQLPYDLYSAMLIRTEQDPAPADGLVPVDPSAPDAPWTEGLRNLVYALQWMVFAAFAVFMWWRICADQRDRHREPAQNVTTPRSSLTR